MIYTHLVLVRSLTTYKECNMDKKEYDEFIINFNQHEMFADSAISVRDYGDRMVIVDKHARNGVINFKTAKNKELADRLIRNTYKTLMSRGQKGCFVYCEDDALGKYIRERLACKA